MMHPSTLVIVAILALVAPAAAQNPCGIAPNDWCPAPAGDPCGHHLSRAACQADPRCYGMPYRDESAIAYIPQRARIFVQLPDRRLYQHATTVAPLGGLTLL